jgi:hypothetical protein
VWIPLSHFQENEFQKCKKNFKIIINSNIVFLAFHFQCNKATARYSLRAVFPPSHPPPDKNSVWQQPTNPISLYTAVLQLCKRFGQNTTHHRHNGFLIMHCSHLPYYLFMFTLLARAQLFSLFHPPPLPNPSPRVPTSLLSPQHPVSKSAATSLQHSHHYAAPCNYKPPTAG